MSNRYTLHCGTENGREIEGGCVSDWVEIGSPPNETSASLMAGMLREANALTDECRGAGFGVPDSLSSVPGDVPVPEPVFAEARRLPEDTTGLGSW